LYIQKSLDITAVEILDNTTEIKAEYRRNFDGAVPGKPSFAFFTTA
jgi:hypothetical protein